MRTAAKLSLTVLLALAAAGSLPAAAQMSAPGPGAVAFPGEARPSEPIPTKQVEAPKPAPAVPAAAQPAAPTTGPDGVPGAVKEVIEKMAEPSSDVTLDDLNGAREAIAKLDVLIDIEKRLTDLVNIRKEREEKTMTAVASALPASAYAPPPAIGGAPGDYGLPDNSMAMPAISSSASSGPSKIEVLKIVGAEGRYVAYVKDGEGGKDKPVRQGEKMPDGSVVSSISRSGVTLSKGKKTSTFQVKDIGKVFGGR